MRFLLVFCALLTASLAAYDPSTFIKGDTPEERNAYRTGAGLRLLGQLKADCKERYSEARLVEMCELGWSEKNEYIIDRLDRRD